MRVLDFTPQHPNLGMGKRMKQKPFQLKGLSVPYTVRSGVRMNRYKILRYACVYVVTMTSENTLSDDFRDGLSPTDLKTVAKTFKEKIYYLQAYDSIEGVQSQRIKELKNTVSVKIKVKDALTAQEIESKSEDYINVRRWDKQEKEDFNYLVKIEVNKDNLERFISDYHSSEPVEPTKHQLVANSAVRGIFVRDMDAKDLKAHLTGVIKGVESGRGEFIPDER